jgi:uncharacterized protein
MSAFHSLGMGDCTMHRLLATMNIATALISFAAFGGPARAESPQASEQAAPAAQAAATPKQFLYMLRLVPRLHDDKAWTASDNAAVSRHFQHLKQATEMGTVILAGRTLEPGDRTFGLVVFEAADEETARRFMESDPAVVAGVMTATLHPYAVALQRKP